MKQKNSLLPYLLVGSIGLGVGYMVGKTNDSHNYSIESGIISYNGELSRRIYIESNRIIVGSLKERIEDLLLESPGKIKQTTEELLMQEE